MRALLRGEWRAEGRGTAIGAAEQGAVLGRVAAITGGPRQAGGLRRGRPMRSGRSSATVKACDAETTVCKLPQSAEAAPFPQRALSDKCPPCLTGISGVGRKADYVRQIRYCPLWLGSSVCAAAFKCLRQSSRQDTHSRLSKDRDVVTWDTMYPDCRVRHRTPTQCGVAARIADQSNAGAENLDRQLASLRAVGRTRRAGPTVISA